MKCETCGKSSPAIYNRGYYWCLVCAAIVPDRHGLPVVSFPSAGKMVPKTIIHDEVE